MSGYGAGGHVYPVLPITTVPAPTRPDPPRGFVHTWRQRSYNLTQEIAMAKIEGFRIRNFRVLRDIALGKLWNLQQAEPLTPMTAVIGKNGVGKSTLFDAFGFLAVR